METEKIHRGQWLQARINENRALTIEMVSEIIGIHRSAIYKWFQKPNLEYRKMKILCDFLNVDLRDTFPESAILYQNQYQTNMEYHKKYFELLEKHQQLSEKYNALLEETLEARKNKGI
jgi:predicted DNA-binding transcriptional regulator AlpA